MHDMNDSIIPEPSRNSLILRAKQLGWTYIHTNDHGKLVGTPPPPADNHELIEITRDVLMEGRQP